MVGCLILATVIAHRLDLAPAGGAAGLRPRRPDDHPAFHAHAAAHRHARDTCVTPTPIGQIGIGAYVQITGTEGAGLRIRATPGQNGDTVFLGEEEEIFKVKDGPQQADGHTWWYLVAPYDETRAGWAAADYLAVVPAP